MKVGHPHDEDNDNDDYDDYDGDDSKFEMKVGHP